jgi:hypothetical protein
MKNFIKKSTILLIVLIFILGLIPVWSACAPLKISLENIVISEDVKKETSEPINPKNEFDVNTKQICATVKYTGAKGSDNWQFKWISLDSGEIVVDDRGKYNKDEPDIFFEGTVSSIYSTTASRVIPSGKYRVEFFSNGVLISTADFKVNKP